MKQTKNAPAQGKLSEVRSELKNISFVVVKPYPGYDGRTLTEYDAVITPEEAKKLVAERNGRNIRKPTRQHIQELAEELRSGKWQYNGEVIKVDWDGYLLDGGNRLSSVAESGVTVTLHFTEGFDPIIINTVDMNRRNRSIKNILEYKHPDKRSGAEATAREVLSLRKRLLCNEQSRNNIGITDSQVMDEFEKDIFGYNNAARVGSSLYKDSNKLFTPKLTSGLYYYLTNDLGYDAAKVETFFNEIKWANPGKKGFFYNVQKKLGTVKRSSAEWTSTMVDAWNSYLRNNSTYIKHYGDWFEPNKATAKAC